jgi:MoaA/NifB/PqqE/SkfB family radical SAM enzyme
MFIADLVGSLFQRRLLRRVVGAHQFDDDRALPRRIRLEASSFCQLRCPSCPTTDGAARPAVGRGYLKLKDFRKLLDLNPSLERIELSNYGEIFLNPHLLQILEYAHGKGVAMTMENGVNLNHVKDEVLEGVVKYQVRILLCSIDGASAETYRTYRVRGDFDTVIRNIEKINILKRRYRTEWPRLIWQFVVFGHNEHELPLAREMAGRLGMEFRPKLTWDSEFSPIRDHAFVRMQTGSPATTREEHERVYGEKYGAGICHQLWDDPQINWDGRVLGCGRNFWGNFGGNAFADGLSESINNEKMNYARDMLRGRVPPRDDIPCSTCENYQVMRDRSRFIERGQTAPIDRQDGRSRRAGKRVMASVSRFLVNKLRVKINRAKSALAHPHVLTKLQEWIRRHEPITKENVAAMLAGIDAQLTAPVGDRQAFDAREKRVKRQMTAPALLIAKGDSSDFPSPTFSVVLPTYNRAHLIGDAIASVRAQSFKDWELLVVDDGSRDRTPEVIDGFLIDRRIRYVRQDHMGHAAARNHALRLSRGALIAYIDSDNLWYPHFLKAAAAAFAALTDVDCFYGALSTEAHGRTVLFEDFDRARLFRGNYVDLNTVAHRRHLIETYGVFDETMDRLVDWDLMLRFTQHKPASRLPVLAAHYRMIDDQRVSLTAPLERNYSLVQQKWPLQLGDPSNEGPQEPNGLEVEIAAISK